MKPLPYRWLPGDHPEIDSMTPEVRGCYWALLDECWTKGELPKDMELLAKICWYSPAKDFPEDIWPKLEKFFYEDEGSLDFPEVYKSFFLDGERDRLDVIRANQSKRAKGKRKPPANRRVAPGKPSVNDSDVVFGPVKITQSPRKAPGIPAVSRGLQNVESQEILKAVGEPQVSPRLTGGYEEPVIKTSQENPVIDLSQKVSHETPGNIQKHVKKSPESIQVVETCKDNGQKMSAEMSTAAESDLDPYFDRLGAWENFADHYPQPGLKDNREAMAEFFKVVINEFWNRRILRALSEFKEHLRDEGWEAQDFIYWLPEWKAWEDRINP